MKLFSYSNVLLFYFLGTNVYWKFHGSRICTIIVFIFLFALSIRTKKQNISLLAAVHDQSIVHFNTVELNKTLIRYVNEFIQV